MTDETTNPNRWTAKVHMQAGTNWAGYAVWLYERDEYHGNIYLGTQADCRKLAEQINRPAHATNDQIVAACGANDYWWRNHSTGRYYAGPTLSGDGSINWPDPAPTAPVAHDSPPTGPTASVDDGEVWLTREGDGWRLGVQVDERGNYVSHLLTADEAAMLFVAAAPTAPADDLPPGVERISDGTLWIRLDPDRTEKVLPDDYEWLSDTAVEMDEPVMVQVRPITPAEPATEWVPVLDAIKNGRVLIAPDGSLMETKGHEVLVYLGRSGRWRCMYDDAGHAEAKRPHADADGKVEVQR